ncbi:MAG: 2-thiouracil desulfurase family protein [Nitrososphaerota archaeon]|nr:2-thiouracil desulfurase family protein [Nitrososphaerota archaeon]
MYYEKKILLLSHCILNPYSKARGLVSREKIEASRRILEELMKDTDIGIVQLPCPELLYVGLGRDPASRSFYDNPDFKKICREIAEHAVKLVKEYEKEGIKTIAYIGIEGSPSCGVKWTHFKREETEKGMGIFTEILLEVMGDAGIQIELLGLPENKKYGDVEELLEKLRSSGIEL